MHEIISPFEVPQGDKLEYSHADFSVGGRDVFRCGSPSDMCYLGDIRYEDIVPNRRIVFTGNMSQQNTLLSAALYFTRSLMRKIEI